MERKLVHLLEHYGDDFAVCGHLKNRDVTPLRNHVTCPDCKKWMHKMGLSTSLDVSTAVRDMCKVGR